MFFQHNFCNYEVMSALPAPSRWNSVVRKRSRSHKCNAGRAVGPSPGWNLWNQNASNGHINKWNSMKFKHIRQPFVPIYPANYILLYIYMSCYIKLYAIFLYFFWAELLRSWPGSSLRCSTATRMSRRWWQVINEDPATMLVIRRLKIISVAYHMYHTEEAQASPACCFSLAGRADQCFGVHSDGAICHRGKLAWERGPLTCRRYKMYISIHLNNSWEVW